MESSIDIYYDGKTLKLEEGRFLHGYDSYGQTNYRVEYYLYNIDTIYPETENITDYKTMFQLLYPYLLRFMLKTRFRNRICPLLLL